MERSRFAIDTSGLAGALDDKLAAIAEAGFSAVTLSAKDLVGEQIGGLEQSVRRVRDSRLAVSGFLALRDFEGLSGRFLDYKIDIAKSMLRMAQQTGADLLLVSSSTSPQASGEIETIVQHLQLLSALATPLGLRIAYEPLAWGRHINDYPSAWQVIEQVNRENVGLVLDSFHLFARGMQPEVLDGIPLERVFLVQLSLHHRFFPGEGEHSRALVELVGRLEAGGYRGRYAFEVANDDYQHCPPSLVLQRAGQAVDWLSSLLLPG